MTTPRVTSARPVRTDKGNSPTHGTGRKQIIENAVIGLYAKAEEHRECCHYTRGPHCEVTNLLGGVAASLMRVRADLARERVVQLP